MPAPTALAMAEASSLWSQALAAPRQTSFASKTSIGIGLPNRKPWKDGQPWRSRKRRCASVSTPSAMTREAEALGQRDDRVRDRGVVGAAGQVAHERAVDLDLVERQPRQIGERRIAGAEIVDREADAERLERVHLVRGAVDVVEHDALGQLEHQPLGRRAGRAQLSATCVDEVGLSELAGADVDRQVQVRLRRSQLQP